jgi:transcriptional regulator with XRE-family HTH domain
MSLSIGQTIRKLRKERNLTQEELAEQLNVTYQAVSKWENETGMPDISQIVPLASVFGISTDVLFGTFGTDNTEEIIRIVEKAQQELGVNNSKPCIEGWHLLQSGLKQFPNNMILLVNTLEYACSLAYPENEGYDETVGKQIYPESVRIASLIISYSQNAADILRAHMIMVMLHAAYGNMAKAREHASNFPWRGDFTANHMNAFISHFEKNYTASAEYSRENVLYSLEALAGAMMQLAYAYEHMQRSDYALEVYNRVKQLIELFPKDEHFSPPTVWKDWGQLYELIAKLQP